MNKFPFSSHNITISQLETMLPMDEKIDFEPGLNSPIPQLDGLEATKNVMFTFKSKYGEEDIEYSLSKIFPAKAVPRLVSRARIGPHSADHSGTERSRWSEFHLASHECQ